MPVLTNVFITLAVNRLDICKACPHLYFENEGHTRYCDVCHCLLPELVKWRGAVCPLNKWPVEKDTDI